MRVREHYAAISSIDWVFDAQTFQIARRSLVATCQLFIENLKLLKKPDKVRSQISEGNFRGDQRLGSGHRDGKRNPRSLLTR
jgi:hypothetical protein